MSSLPAELDFSKDPVATPDRMDRAMAYIVARLRAVEAIQPSFQAAIEQIRAVGLVKVSEGILPVLDVARVIRDELQAMRDLWTADLLPAEVAQAAATTVALQLAGYRHRWLGAKAATPTVDDVGAAVEVGAMYFDTGLGTMRVLSAGGWIDVSNIASDAAVAVGAKNTATQKAADAATSAQTALNAAAGAAAAVLAQLQAAQDATIAARDVTIAARNVTTAARDTTLAARDQAVAAAGSINPANYAPVGHTHNASEIVGLTSGAELRRLSVPGRYFPHDANAGAASANATVLTPDRIYLVPFSTPGAYDAIVFQVGYAEGNARVGLFTVDTDGFPGAVVDQSPSFALSSTGDKVCLLSQTRTLASGGRWWIALIVSGAPYVFQQAIGPTGMRMFGSPSGTVGNTTAPIFTQAFGPFVDLTAQTAANFTYPTAQLPTLMLRSA